MKMFTRDLFALAKSHNSLSMVVPTSKNAVVNEAVIKKIDNDTGPSEKETLVVLSLVSQTHPYIGQLFLM